MSKHFRPLLVIGTRPEGIKMAPLVQQCLAHTDEVSPILLFTGQHPEMLAPIAEYFHMEPDIQLDVMVPGQSLAELTARCLSGLDRAIAELKPHCVVAQGDTTSVMAAAMTSFFRGIPFVHVEAGLRTGDLTAPFPEEYHRRIASLTTTLHCAPTQHAANQLLNEGIDEEYIRVTGNTVIDALLATRDRELARDSVWTEKYSFLQDREMVLITAHRRENHGEGLKQIFTAVRNLAQRFSRHAFVFPLHRNPQVQTPAREILGECPNVTLLDPLAYPEFVWMMNRSRVIISDSGGVQEEAPSLGKPVVVTREVTERPEASDAGALVLVGTSSELIEREVSTLLTDDRAYRAMQIENNPYGCGDSAQKILHWMLEKVYHRQSQPTDAIRTAKPR
jgi:UDP-N-acetylglucosamine 2-epimerase (non-hydrolysing)